MTTLIPKMDIIAMHYRRHHSREMRSVMVASHNTLVIG
jgi:hypothetical protein